MKNIIILSLLFFSACSSKDASNPATQPSGIKIGAVSVSVAELTDERENRAEKIDLDGQVKERVQKIMEQRGLFDQNSQNTLRIHLTSFKLRHGATRFFTGFMSGSDHLRGTISVGSSSANLLTEEVEVSGGNGNPFAISSASRGANLSNDFAQKAVKILQTHSSSTANDSAVVKLPNNPSIDVQQISPSKDPSSQIPLSRKAEGCSTEQILSLKKAGLSDEKVKAACGD